MKITIPSCCEGDNLTSMSLFWVGEGPTFCQSDGYFSEMPRSELEMLWNEVVVGVWSGTMGRLIVSKNTGLSGSVRLIELGMGLNPVVRDCLEGSSCVVPSCLSIHLPIPAA